MFEARFLPQKLQREVAAILGQIPIHKGEWQLHRRLVSDYLLSQLLQAAAAAARIYLLLLHRLQCFFL